MNKGKRLLFVHQGAELYGSDKTFLQSVRAYRAGYPDAKITVLLPSGGPLVERLAPFVDEIKYGGVWVLRKSTVRELLGVGFIDFFKMIYSAWKVMRGYDICYINTLVVFNFLIALVFSSTKGKVVHVHEIQVGFLGNLFSLLLCSGRAKIIYNSIATSKSYFLLPWQNRRVVPNGVKPVACDHRVGVDGGLRLLMIGRINDWKGQDLLVRAISNLERDIAGKINLKIVGDVYGDQEYFRTDLMDLISAQSLDSIVECEGFKDDPAAVYDWADIVCVPSKKPEPFGLVAIEAMSHGKCVIAADHGGLSEIVEDGVTGFLFEANNVVSLCMAISNALDDRNSVKNMGLMGRDRFLKLYTEDKYLSAIVENVCE